MDNPLLIAAFFTLAIALFLYLVLVPRTGRVYTQGDYSDNSNPILKGASAIGNEVFAALPEGLIKVKKRTGSSRVENLLQRSANPWNIKAADFMFFQIVFAVLFAIGGLLVGLFLQFGVQFFLPAWIPAFGGLILGWIYPKNTYESAAKQRDLEFKRQLPEALDLMRISLNSAKDFVFAMRETIPNMQPGVLRDEFKNMIKAIDAGATQHQALQGFADRAPNDSITTFVKAVQEGVELEVSIIDILESRAEASRREFFALIQDKTATLSGKMMGILTPTLIPAVLLVALTPAAFSILKSL